MAKTTSKMLFVRMKEAERRDVDALAQDYGMDTSEFVRAVLEHVKSERPALIRRVVPQRRPATIRTEAPPVAQAQREAAA